MVLVGCGYARRAPDVARDAIRATERILGKPARAVRACCGLPLLHAGDRPGFAAAARALAAEVERASDLVAVDPGCARASRVESARAGVAVRSADLFVDLAARAVDRMTPLRDPPKVRWHDPCQLGRGLGRYDEPRAILARLTGVLPGEFPRSRAMGECSGG